MCNISFNQNRRIFLATLLLLLETFLTPIPVAANKIIGRVRQYKANRVIYIATFQLRCF